MTTMTEKEKTKPWVRARRRAAPVLQRMRIEEMRNLDHAKNTQMVDALLELGLRHAIPRKTSGFVEMQRISGKLRKPDKHRDNTSPTKDRRKDTLDADDALER